MPTALPAEWDDARHIVGDRLAQLEEHRHQVSTILPDVVQLVVLLGESVQNLNQTIGQMQESMGQIHESMTKAQKQAEEAAQLSQQLTERVSELERCYDVGQVDV